jgi:hypothetical protein
MKPLSIAASVASLINLASEATKVCYRATIYCKTAKNAPETVRQVISELDLLRKILQDIEEIYNGEPSPCMTWDALFRSEASAKRH